MWSGKRGRSRTDRTADTPCKPSSGIAAAQQRERALPLLESHDASAEYHAWRQPYSPECVEGDFSEARILSLV